MQLLCDENFPYSGVKLLRQAGHDVVSIQEESPGIPDTAVLVGAAAENRILLTFDRDYGELIYRHHEPAPPAILYFRQGPYTPAELFQSTNSLLRAEPSDLLGQFVILTPQSVRRKPLP